ncbi:MAG: hypothetical protein HQK52_17855 [Oligoflexia bacterium]|nr:hypothetical protein [Oligoflexia bacterium]
MTIDARKLLKEIKGKKIETKQRVTLLLNIEAYSEFQKICKQEGLAASHLVDRFIQDFIVSYETGKKKPKK